MTAKQITVSGRVQEVFFRATSRDIAVAMGLKGWVRNTDEGNVEMHIEGPQEAVDRFEKWCHTGPPSAKVERIFVQPVDDFGYTSFEIDHEWH
ncbi:MAG: acylphosphatase [bacterium]|nr:acylphosphatase [bacterium]